ncbi:hypothetical protein [Marinobacterium lutimaris]|uniref:Antitoxin Xre/MbcA/ParS-like toxin-binding domain-containing protein n=1 Tax=Marinobacterium lutimaris TaxID=568106 RepID=A0A1H6C497_9GAMM|nr:hypothetical protein [Marinobacterium lutimaris]SEG67455.1 hypothetical protein SAMN05444390_103135 [Marinobacterium lutimaris]
MSTSLTEVLNVLVQWQCTPNQALAIIKLDPDQPFPEVLSEEQCERVNFVLNIHTSLGTAFDDTEEIYGYMSSPHEDPYYEGKSPLELISSGDLTVFERVCWHIDAMRVL